MLNKLVKSVDGWKTYIAAFLTALTGLLAWANGHASFSTAVTSAPGILVFLGAVAAAVRSAIKKVEAALARIEAKLPASVAAVVDPEVAKVEADVAKAV